MAAALLDGFFFDPQPLRGHLILGKYAREHLHFSLLPSDNADRLRRQYRASHPQIVVSSLVFKAISLLVNQI
jgi:hypothetical protein